MASWWAKECRIAWTQQEKDKVSPKTLTPYEEEDVEEEEVSIKDEDEEEM